MASSGACARALVIGSAYGIRTRVTAVRGQRPGPLDECAGSAGTRKIACGFFAVKVGERRPGGRHSVPAQAIFWAMTTQRRGVPGRMASNGSQVTRDSLGRA